MDIFVSVATGLNTQQEEFVAAVEDRLRAKGHTPRTIGRNTFSADAPLQAVTDLMKQCSGVVVIALERFHFPHGEERRGTDQHRSLADVKMTTAWNQIEAAMAYDAGLPLLVIVEQDLRKEGLLERGNDWYVQELPITPSSLSSPAFSGILDNWHDRIIDRASSDNRRGKLTDISKMSVGELVFALRPAQAWTTLGAIVAALSVAFAAGAKLFG